MQPGAELKIKQHMASLHNLNLDVVENEVEPIRIDEDRDLEVIDADNDSSADESLPNSDEDMAAHEAGPAGEFLIQPDIEEGMNLDIPIGVDNDDDDDYNYEVSGDGGEQSVVEFDHQTDEDVDNADNAEEPLEEEEDDISSKLAILN